MESTNGTIETTTLTAGSCVCTLVFPLFVNLWICIDVKDISSNTDLLYSKSKNSLSLFNYYFNKYSDMYKNDLHVERTLALIKPEVIDKEKEIENFMLRAGFTILRKRKVLLSAEKASDFYAEHYGKVFFPSLISYMSSGPVIAYMLAKQDAVNQWRRIIGPTDSDKARRLDSKSLRAVYGTDNEKNAFHGSDSFQSARNELKFFFPDEIIEPITKGIQALDYLAKHVNPTLLRGLTEICKNKPENPVILLSDWLTQNNPNKPRIED